MVSLRLTVRDTYLYLSLDWYWPLKGAAVIRHAWNWRRFDDELLAAHTSLGPLWLHVAIRSRRLG